MKFFLKPADPQKLDVDILITYCFEKEWEEFSSLGSEFLRLVKEAAEKEDFEGKEEQILIFSSGGLISAYKFLLTGLGKQKEFDLFSLYKAVAQSIKKGRESKPVKIGIVIPDFWFKKFDILRIIQSIVEGVNLSSYQFLKYKSEEERKKIRAIEEVILPIRAGKLREAEIGLNKGLIYSEAVIFSRDLINEPPEITTPTFLAQTARNIAKESGGVIKVNILEEEEVKKIGMGAFLGVAVGSDKPPKFIRLSYKPANVSKKVVLIGKGITFDTGGLSLKTQEAMETMKLDMAGAAAVLSIFKALPKLNPRVEVVGLIPACENMPSGRALKPGDILRAMNGKMIEVLNTDAEGRLTLADAISYANIKEKPEEIIDLATLTGACMVALGQEIAGLWGNDEKLIEGIEKAGKNAAERVWSMPLFGEYKELLKSHIADIKNVQTGKYGGAITAALFLSEFVGETPWVHLDIAGPAFAQKDTPLIPQGGAGFGVRLLLEYLSA